MEKIAGPFDFWVRFGSVTGVFQTCSFAKAEIGTRQSPAGTVEDSVAPVGRMLFCNLQPAVETAGYSP